MNITKSGLTHAGGGLEAGEMEIINSFARRELKPEEVYTFSLILCDNDIDRDHERFEEKTLRELAELFVGKTGISDHEWKSERQVARIYRTEFLTEPGRKTADGRDYACVKAWAYMLRSEENAGLIADIEGGIKRETSVGCAVAESVCSICGKHYGSGECGHVKGQEYGGRVCHVLLRGAVDAYEWSFVAVPAQRKAGVTKAYDVSKGLKGFAESEGGAFAEEFEQLSKQAALGRRYVKGLRDEVKRLGLICDREVYKTMGAALEAMDCAELEDMKKALERRVCEKLPLPTQLPGMGEVTRFDGDEYLI